MAVISALYIYPIKGCRGIRVSEWPVVERGFLADRRWMVVDAQGNFVTQRQVRKLCLVDTRLERDAETLNVSAPGAPALTLPRAHETGLTRPVRIWSDQSLACVHPEGSAWFSDFLGATHELVYMPDEQHRQVNPALARSGDIVSFADGYPFLLISEASLEDLNQRLDEPIGMERFRPNIVVTGTEPFAEDEFSTVRLGDVTFRGAKRCDRCVVTTIDPLTAESGKEPLRTLARFRLQDAKVWFGMNLIHDGPGVLRVGDEVHR